MQKGQISATKKHIEVWPVSGEGFTQLHSALETSLPECPCATLMAASRPCASSHRKAHVPRSLLGKLEAGCLGLFFAPAPSVLNHHLLRSWKWVVEAVRTVGHIIKCTHLHIYIYMWAGLHCHAYSLIRTSFRHLGLCLNWRVFFILSRFSHLGFSQIPKWKKQKANCFWVLITTAIPGFIVWIVSYRWLKDTTSKW